MYVMVMGQVCSKIFTPYCRLKDLKNLKVKYRSTQKKRRDQHKACSSGTPALRGKKDLSACSASSIVNGKEPELLGELGPTS